MVNSLSYTFRELFGVVPMEDVAFALVFLIFFGVAYFSLVRFFSKKGSAGTPDAGKTLIHNKGIIVLISVCFSLLATFGLTRNYWILDNFGSLIALVSGIFPIVILIAFLFLLLKPLKEKFGGPLSGMVVVLIAWGILRYLRNSNSLYSFPYVLQDWIVMLSHAGVLIAGLIIALILGKIVKQ